MVSLTMGCHKAVDTFFISVTIVTVWMPLLGYRPEGASGLFLREAMRRSASQDVSDAEHIQLLNTAATRHGRVKRVANVIKMPDHFRFRLGGNRKSKGLIVLQRVLGSLSSSDSGEMADSFPVFEIGEDGPVRVNIPADVIPSRAFYRQVNKSGVVMVTQNPSTSLGFALDGTLTIDNKEFVISPNTDHTGSGHDHVLISVNTTVLDPNATDDVITVDEAENVTYFSGPPPPSKKAIVGRPWRDRRYIELAMVADYAAFRKFRDYTGGKTMVALMEMYLYYGFVSLSASLRYETIHDHEKDINVKVVPKSLFVCTLRRFCPWTEDHVIVGTDKIEYGKSLRAFRQFVNGDMGPKGDHRMLFTGYRMARSDGKTGVVGVAYLGTGCSDWDMSMVHEFYTSVTSAVAAHELGHSFSAKHDTDESSMGCTNSDFYVMAAYLGFPTSDGMSQHPYSFSNCSARYIRNHLKSSKGECTQNKPMFSMKTQFIAGQFYNADAQCALARGVGSIFCRTFQELRTFNQMCVRTFCSEPRNPSHCVGVVPLHRTSCGNMRWCDRGRCVKNMDAPATPHDRCPQGDAPNIPCSQHLCTTDTYINILCCDTCNGITTPKTTPSTTPSPYPPSCGKVCQCLIDTTTVLCFIKCVAGVPC